MNTILIIRFIAFSGLLYLLYILVFKRFSFFAGNRWLLLCIPIVSFVIPLFAPNFTNTVTPNLVSFQLEEVILQSTKVSPQTNQDSINWKSAAYFSGVAITILMLLAGLFKAIRIKRNSTENVGNIYYSSSISSAYTFFKSIIIPLSLKEHKDIDTIIKHEQVHVRQWHGLDNLYYQIITALTWFNPFIHLLAKELRQTHECLADEEAIEKTSRKEYAHLLLNSAFGNELNFPLAAGTATPFFNSSLIKTRITMIYKTKTNRHFKWAYLALIPLLAAMTLYSCDKAQEEKATQPSNQIEHKDVVSFSQVDQPPLFPGCDPNTTKEEQMTCFQQGIMNHIAKNFKYPESAQKAGVEGKMFVQFTIDKTGNTKDVNVTTKFGDNSTPEIEGHCGVEAIQLIHKLEFNSPAFLNGKPTAISFTLPINMKLK